MTTALPHELLGDTTRIDYDSVRVGEPLPLISFVVTPGDVEDYRQSVGTPEPRSSIATMHLLAITLAAITERMPLPATCVHVGQELEWTRAVEAPAEILVRFALVSRRTAGGAMLSAFSLHLATVDGEIASGRILLTS